jgi:hypothetical protein
LLLVVWVTGRFGTCALVGVIGSPVTLLLGPPQMVNPMICFAASAVIFDLLMSVSHHKIRISMYSFAVAIIATIVSAFLAGIVYGLLFTPSPTFQTALTFWGAWHTVGGIMTLAITLPIITALEKANVRKLKGDRE